MECACGCGQPVVHLHHAAYVQHIRGKARLDDERNLVPVALACHAAHHNRSKPYPLTMLPDSVFEFAGALFGKDAAYVYLTRRYAGDDPRADALIDA